MKNKFKIFLLIVTASISGLPSYSQTLSNDDIIKTESIDIIKPYKPTLSEAFKISTNPKIEVSDDSKPQISYNIQPKELKIPFRTSKISPARIKSEKIPDMHNFYAKAGFGRFTTPVAEIYYNNKWSRDYSVGAFVKHYSSKGQILNSGFSDNELGIYGKKFFNRYTLSGDVNYERNAFNFYGAENTPSNDVNKIDRQAYNKLSANTELSTNFTKKSKLTYKIGLGYNYLFDKYGASGQNGILNGKLINKTGRDSSLFVNFKTDIGQYNSSVFYHTNSIYSITPNYSMSISALRINTGFNMVYEISSNHDLGINIYPLRNNNKVHFYPALDLTYKISGKYLIGFGGLIGNLVKNNFHSLVNENPYLSENISFQNTNEKLHFFGGLKGIINNFSNYKIKGSIINFSNLPLFTEDNAFTINEGTRFKVIYDAGTMYNVSAELTGYKTDKFRFSLKGDYFQFQMNKEEYAWHKPTFTMSINGFYSIGNKINLKSEIYAFDKTYVKKTIPSESSIKYDGFIDANLSIEYKYSKALSVFLDIKNLANKNYYLWHNYKSSGFNVIGGIKYAF